MVTVIIVNYKSAFLTARAAASVLSDRADAQLIVVDNSEDAAETAELRRLLPSGAELIVSPKNIGFGRACTLGFEQARFELFFLLNPDASLLPGCLDALAAFLQQTPQAGAAAPLTFWDSARTWLLPPFWLPTPWSELRMGLAVRFPRLGERLSRTFRRWALRCLNSDRPVRQNMLSGGAVMLRRSAVMAAGGLFDPDYFMYFEDTDLCLRLQRAGYTLHLVPAARACHAWESVPDKTALSTPNRMLYFQKQFPGSLLFRLHQRLECSRLPVRLPACHDLGVCADAPEFPVSPALQGGWVLEASPHPLLIPALYRRGSGSRCTIADEVWQLLGPGHYWARLAGPEGEHAVRYHWNKE